MFGIPLNQLVVLPLLAAVAVGLALLIHSRPQLGVAVWFISIAFVPVWMGVTVSIYFAPAVVAGALVLISSLPGSPPRYGLADLMAAFFFVSCVAPVFTGGATLSTIFGAILQWLLAFLIGRLLPNVVDLRWIYAAFAIVMAAASVLAIIEFFTQWNPFLSLGPSNGLKLKWGAIQGRGDLFRAEGAFGHSIALGCSIAIAIPLLLGSRLRLWVRLVLMAILLCGAVVTVSRLGMACSSIGVLMSVFFLKDSLPKRLRVAILTLFAITTAVLLPYVLGIFTTAGDEATVSANYRGSLTELIPDMQSLGLSGSAYRSPSGDVFFGRFQSIDSQILLTGLTYGWMALLMGVVLLLMGIMVVARRRATPPTIAVVAQIPALATVALITQYSAVFWFAVGLAVASQLATDAESPSRRPTALSRSLADGLSRAAQHPKVSAGSSMVRRAG